MKVKVKKQKNVFKPIEMTIVFESQEEINDLYNRINVSDFVIEETMGLNVLEHDNYCSGLIYEQIKSLAQ
tara:strand:+ start:610 stop:819 length:210 start_codon:yes stop_codon:yes gene_type:complete